MGVSAGKARQEVGRFGSAKKRTNFRMSAENSSAGGFPAANSSNSSQVLELAPEFV